MGRHRDTAGAESRVINQPGAHHEHRDPNLDRPTAAAFRGVPSRVGARIDQSLRWFGLATHLAVGVFPFTATGLLAPSGASSPWAPGTRSSPS